MRKLLAQARLQGKLETMDREIVNLGLNCRQAKLTESDTDKIAAARNLLLQVADKLEDAIDAGIATR